MNIFGFISNYVLLFLLLISILVFVHEYGHYAVGRMMGIRAEVFSVGFGPEIVGWTSPRTGTRWRLSLIPLGGYVKFLGEMIPGDRDQQDSRVAPADRAFAFHSKPVWRRAAVVAAGPAANLLFAWVMTAIMLAIYGQAYTEPRVGHVEPESPAARAGVRAGDILVRIDGAAISRFEDFEQHVQIHPNSRVEVIIRRGSEDLALMLELEQTRFVDRFGNVHRLGRSGVFGPNELPIVGSVLGTSPAAAAELQRGDRVVSIDGKPVERFSDIPRMLNGRAGKETEFVVERAGRTSQLMIVPEVAPNASDPGQGRIGIMSGFHTGVRQFGPAQAAVVAVEAVVRECATFYTLMRQLILGMRPIDELSGPMRMAKATGEVAQLGWTAVISFAILISVLLGLFNLLPVPMLDGGHLLYYAIEAVLGRPLGPRAQEYGFRFGFIVVMSATIVATWNDVTQIFGHLWR